MGVLRTRMEQDLVVRGRSPRTREAYLHAVAALTSARVREAVRAGGVELVSYAGLER